MKKIISFILIFILLFQAIPVFADEAAPSIKAEAAVLIDMTTGSVLYDKNADEKMYPASTAKMLTCILALENLDMNEKITIEEKELDGYTGTNINTQPGEKIDIGLLVTAMMVASANDVAYVLANRVAGSIPAFVDMMNAKAEELGCTNTHFTNPSGSDDDKQYSSCNDLAKIASYCMQNEVFRRIVARSTFVVPPTNKNMYRNLATSNFLLDDESRNNMIYVDGILRFCKYDGCTGIQGGYSDKAGACLVSSATQNGTSLIAVVLKSEAMDRYADSIYLLDYGFNNYKTLRLTDAGFDPGRVAVKGGKAKDIGLSVNDIGYITVAKDVKSDSLSLKLDFEEIEAPVQAGECVGKLNVLDGEKILASYDVFATESVERDRAIAKIGLIILIVLGAIVLLLAGYVLYQHRKAKKSKTARLERRAKLEEQDASLIKEWEEANKNKK